MCGILFKCSLFLFFVHFVVFVKVNCNLLISFFEQVMINLRVENKQGKIDKIKKRRGKF